MQGHEDSKAVASLTTFARWKECLRLNPQFKWSVVLTFILVVIFLAIDIGIAASKPALRSPKSLACSSDNIPSTASLEAIPLQYSTGWHGEWAGGGWSFLRLCPSSSDVRLSYQSTLQGYTRAKGSTKSLVYTIWNCNDEEVYQVFDPNSLINQIDLPVSVGDGGAQLTVQSKSGTDVALVSINNMLGQLEIYPPEGGNVAPLVTSGYNSNGTLYFDFVDNCLEDACDPLLVGAVTLRNAFTLRSGGAPTSTPGAALEGFDLTGRDGCNDFYYVTMALIITVLLIAACIFGVVSYNWYRRWKIQTGAYSSMQMDSNP